MWSRSVAVSLTFGFIAIPVMLQVPSAAQTLGAPNPSQATAMSIALGEFLTEEPFTAGERNRLGREIEREFAANRAKARANATQLAAFVQKLPNAQRYPVDAARFRKNVLGALVAPWVGKAVPPDEMVVDIVIRHTKPVWANVGTQSVITRRDISALLDSDNFIAGLVGRPRLKRAETTRGLVSQLVTLSNERKDSIANAEWRWAATKHVWAEIAPAQRSELVRQMRRTIKRRQDVANVAEAIGIESEKAILNETTQMGLAPSRQAMYYSVVLEALRRARTKNSL